MEYSVKLIDGTKFIATADQSVLDAATASGVKLPYSCKNGSCGVCRTKVIAGRIANKQPAAALSPSDIDNGYILTCCAITTQALELDAENLIELEGIEEQVRPTKIEQMIKLTDSIILVRLRLPPHQRFNYLPGQFIQITSPNGDTRAYSIANAPAEKNTITLIIERVNNGILSDYWFNEAKLDDLLRIRGPYGSFFLRKKSYPNLVFLTTGTGIAPALSILEQLEKEINVREFNSIKLYFGTRSPEDVFFSNMISDFTKMRLNIVISRPDKNWKGRTGYVQQAFLEDIEHLSNLQDTMVYACGSQKMVESSFALLKNYGLKEKQFLSDVFIASGP